MKQSHKYLSSYDRQIEQIALHAMKCKAMSRYRNGDLVNVNDTERYEGGNSENVALVIRATDKEDVGNYTCQLSNVIGKGISEQQIDLDVQFAPIVEVLMIPEGPVKESDESNVTLYCNILEANPAVLTKVRWYANATLLKELPDCEETKEDLCHIDPSKLLLESIGRGFFYNYSCEGYNAAGWGPRSEDKELMVHYEPGPATLTHFPLTAVKKKSVTFSCSVDDPGYPESNRSVKSYEKNTAFASSFNSINPFTKSFASTTKSYSTPTNPTNAPQIGDQFHIHFHTVQALQPSEAEAAYEALIRQNSPLLDKHQQQHSNQTIQKETHTLIGLNNQTPLCTLLTLTTFSPKSQILTLYNVAQPTNMAADISLPSPSSTTFSDINSSLQQTQQKQYHQLSLYRKMGSFTHRAQMLIHPHRFRWLRGGRGPLQDIVTKDWTVEPVGLDSRTNYSCYAYNEGGKGVMATVDLVVHAPPFFIKNLVPYTGMLHTSRTANLTCRIECVPRCEITWLKGTEPIELNDTRYFIKEKYVDASPATGDFESMLSVLHFNMSNWPNQKFDIESDSANYTCVSTGNTVGPE
ncbi:unnamed protein product [Ceratitis capitata]|uniref:(Mediterranean fruit fly) hypothetical protein n=1 Tax=Ceratitis capitata TaxID=7213 RepID=A0A811V7C0_CERCA|nr:unnamed protein product [Ceratitis capitata]